MKYILIVASIAIAIFMIIPSSDGFDDPILFKGGEYKLAEVTGNDVVKTYQYFKSGRANGHSDYVQILVMNKSLASHGDVKKTGDLVRNTYKVKPISGSRGEFGVFNMPGEERNYYSYLLVSESSSHHWFINYVIQSNFGGSAIDTQTARNNSEGNIVDLEAILTKIMQRQ